MDCPAADLQVLSCCSHKEVVIAGDYALRSKLKQSSLSTVWEAERRSDRQAVVVKQVYLPNLNKHLSKSLDCELQFLSSVNHPNIIRLLDFFEDESCMYLVMEFCAGGDLGSYIRNQGKVKEQTARRFMQQIGAGLEVLHSQHVVHRDLKPENILLSGLKDELVLKIADFGLSSTVQADHYLETVCGSPLYMAPEVLQFQRYDEKVDMWSVGAILFELLNGFPPFSGRNNVQLLQNIKSCSELPFSTAVHSQLHADCIDICSRLLSTNPAGRLSFEEFYWHRFLSRKGIGARSLLAM